ncbi:MAG: hypothetical protein HC842_08170 [Cytophagales bacterium]|nr:hypothetical protein [Cytophagales bacterium]
MTISEIKSQLPIQAILDKHGLKMDKNKRLRCPFHEDKKPSMQVYPETNTVYCFSTNCPRHGKAMDQIDLEMYLSGTDKHQAILECIHLLRGQSPGTAPVVAAIPEPVTPDAPGQAEKPRSTEDVSQAERIAILSEVFSYFKHALPKSAEAKAYLEKRHLLEAWQAERFETGYNSGQFHHGTRKAAVEKGLKVGLLSDKNHKGYQVWAKNCLIFPLRNALGEVVSLYGRSLTNDEDQRHFYLRNRQGLFPGYPPQETRKVILTESVIDAASIPILPETFTLALYGTNGLSQEHLQALSTLEKLDELIFFLDGDEAGEKAVKSYCEKLSLLPWVQQRKIKLSKVNLLVSFPGQDVNSILDTQPVTALVALLNRRSSPEVDPRQVSPIGSTGAAHPSKNRLWTPPTPVSGPLTVPLPVTCSPEASKPKPTKCVSVCTLKPCRAMPQNTASSSTCTKPRK